MVLLKRVKWATTPWTGDCSCTDSKLLGKILNGLIYILNHLLAQYKHSRKAIGFFSFEDAYGLYYGFFNSSPGEAPAEK